MVQSVVTTAIIVTITGIRIVLITVVMTVLIETITAAEDNKVLTEAMALNARKVASISHPKAGVMIVEEVMTTANVLQRTISKAGQAVPAEDKIIFPGLYVAKGPQVSGLFCLIAAGFI
jgi:hypothetical protein